MYKISKNKKSKNKRSKNKTKNKNSYLDFIHGKTQEGEQLRNHLLEKIVKIYGKDIKNDRFKLNGILVANMAKLWTKRKRLAENSKKKSRKTGGAKSYENDSDDDSEENY